MSNEYGAIPLTIANDVGSKLKKKMGSLTGFAPVDWAETINKLGNKLPERTVSGAVCSFSDGADDVPMSGEFLIASSADIVNIYRIGQNLFDRTASGIINGKYYNASGAEASSTGWMISAPISLTEGLTYYGWRMIEGGTRAGCNIYDSSDVLIRTIELTPNNVFTFTAQTGESYIRLSVRKTLDEYKNAVFSDGETRAITIGSTVTDGSVIVGEDGSCVYDDGQGNTTSLDPINPINTVLGSNIVWCDTGDSEVTYFAQPSGGITPVFTEEVICDNSSASSTLTFTEDWHDYDFLQFKLTNSSSGIITYITTTPDILDEIFARSSNKVLFNEFSNDQYALYTKSSDLSWSRSGTRNANVTEVKGLTATNCTVSTEWIYKRGAITASNVTITAPKYFEAYDEIYMASCDGDSDDTMPCILPVRAGCAGYNFYGNNGRNCVRLTGNTATDTYGKDETKNIFCMMGINYEEV